MPATVEATLATTKPRTRNSCGSTSGEGWTREESTKPAAASAEPAKHSSTRGLVQPQSSPVVMAVVSRASATARATAPRRSGIRRRPGLRLSTSERRARTIATSPTGTLTRNAQRQLPHSTRAPPIGGPSPAATAALAPHSPTAWARREAGKASITRAREAGISMAAPRACTTRASTRNGTDPAAAHSREAATKRPSPVVYSRRRPMRSARRPQATIAAASTML